MKRKKLSRRKSKKIFKKSAGKVHPKNLKRPVMMRGGTRW